MEQSRIELSKAAPEGYRAMLEMHHYLQNCGLDTVLLDLVYLRASQVNGCAFCTDMHWKDLRAAGVPESKLALLTAWHESPGFSEREKAALAWTEAVTLVAATHVPDDVYAWVSRHFSESEIANLTIAVGMINLWNRTGVALRKPAGEYQPAATLQSV